MDSMIQKERSCLVILNSILFEIDQLLWDLARILVNFTTVSFAAALMMSRCVTSQLNRSPQECVTTS